uniref:DNA helicase Pif1-like 2B domain-containing protein n=1 Tax=Lactuca sativa TaxID=4236 RepID=A0A9R1WS30_LACSA|nr:hypothetical protein LSAT_V11C900474040 [Lactuca sativa]
MLGALRVNGGELGAEMRSNLQLAESKAKNDKFLDKFLRTRNQVLHDPSYFQDKTILVPTNEEFDAPNDYILGLMKDERKTYMSSNSLFTRFFEESIYSSVVLNGFKASRISNHELTLKIGVTVMLLRNIEQTKGLCNGTRLHIVRIRRHAIEA